MPTEIKYLAIGFVIGLLVPYTINLLNIIINLFSLIESYFTNIQTLHASKVQAQIDELSAEYNVKEPCIGFRYDEATQDEEECQEEDKINNTDFK